ncbi:unnamed protein product [Ixodes hexagonus]
MDNLDEAEEIVLILLSCSLLALQQEMASTRKKKPRRRRWWVRPCLRERETLGHANKLLPLLRSRDVEYYRDASPLFSPCYLRMPPRTFDTLLELLGPRICKQDTRFRKAIPADHRLALAVRFLAAGETVRSSSFNFMSGRSTACHVVPEVCQAIWNILGPIYVVCPSTEGEWLRERWNMPHCVGAIDGKHVNIECPAKSGSLDRNYKNSFSKSLLAVSDANYRFLYVEVGHNGSEADGGVFRRSDLQRKIEENLQGIPPDAALGSVGSMPFFFVGDEAFPLRTYLMRPYPRKSQFEQTHQRRIFNYRLSRARRVVENTFGIMAQRWRILRRPFKATNENVTRIVSACVALHNFLLQESAVSRAAYCPPGTADYEDWHGQLTEGSWRAEENGNSALSALPGRGFRSASLAYTVRDKLCKYFITDGKVPWQESMVKGNKS